MIAVNHQKAVFSTMFVTAPIVSRDPRAHASFGRAPPCFINTFMTLQQSLFSHGGFTSTVKKSFIC